MSYKNGFFQILIKDGVFLKIFPPKDGGRPIGVKEVAAYLDAEKVCEYDINTLNKAILGAEGITEIPLSSETCYPIDEKMEIKITDDNLKVYARFYPPSNGGSLLNTDSIIRLLNQKQVVAGIDESGIRTFLHKREYCRTFVVAKGKEPRHGRDAEIEYHFETERKAKPTMLEDGSVDFHHLDAINLIKKDTCLATLYEQDLGDEGTDVFGNSILPRKVKSLHLKYGKNIYESEDKKQIFSSIDGHVHLEGDKIFVSDTYEVLGDVDASTGDIDYEGNVDIKGNVRTGFTVKASGDINVKGVVEGATLIAGGEVIIQRGIQGMNKGVVECGGNLFSKFIENSDVKTGGGIVTEAIMHSSVFAQGDVIVDGKKGLVTGGRVCSRSLIELKTGGSDMGTITKLEVGADPEIVEKCHLLAKRMPEIQRDIENNQKIVDMYSKKMANGDKLSTEKLLLLKDAKITLENATKEFQDNMVLMEQYQEEISANSSGLVKVFTILYPGVEVSIADVNMHIRKDTRYCRLIRDGADIRVQPY